MKLLHDFLLFLFPAVFGLSVDAGGGGSGGGEGAGGGAGAGSGAGEGGKGGGEGAAGAGAGSGSPANFDLRSHLDDGGKFKPGWAKGAGLPEAWEGKYTDPLSALRAGASAQSMIGADKATVVRIPGANASQGERDAYYAAIGRPEKPEGYALTKPDKIGDVAVPDGIWDAKRASAFQAKAHELGLTPAQAKSLAEFSISDTMASMGDLRQQQENIVKQSTEALRKEWGADFDANLAAAKRAAEQFGGKDLINHPGLGNDPVMIKALAAMGKATGETPGKGVRQQAGDQRMTPSDAKAAAESLTGEIAGKLKLDRNFKNSPEYARMAARKTELFKAAYPEEG